MQAASSQYQVQQEKVRWEEQRKYAQEQAHHKGEIAKFEDQLARKRQEEAHEKERQRNAEVVALQEQSKKRIEAEKLAIEQRIQEERRATEAFRLEMEKEQILWRYGVDAPSGMEERSRAAKTLAASIPICLKT